MELYKISDDVTFRFYQVPKQLFEDDRYRNGLSVEAKLIYGILLDRLALSKKNNWANENGELYLIYTKKDIADKLAISEGVVYRSFEKLNKIGLIKQVRQGLNKPNIIYIYKLNADYTRNFQNSISRTNDIEVQDIPNWQCNDTEFNNTDLIDNYNDKGIVSSETNSSQKAYSFNQYCNEYHVDNDVIENVKYYLETYEQYQNRIHPRLKVSQWQDVTDTWFGIYDENLDKYYEVDSEGIELMINKHFDTEYKNCDYNILHFVSEGVKVRRFYEAVYRDS